MKKRLLFLTMTLILVMSVTFGGCSKDTGDGETTVTQIPSQDNNGSGQDDGSKVTQPVSDNGNGNSDSKDDNGNGTSDNAGTTDSSNTGNEQGDTDNSQSKDNDNGNNGNEAGNDGNNNGGSSESDSENKTDYAELVPSYATGEYKKKDLKSSFNPDKATKIELNGSTIAVNGDGATADGNKVTITAKGTYLVSGTLDDGQIIVNAGDEDDVRLILNGATVNCSNSSCIYGINADKIIITLVDGTVNTFTDSADYIFANAEKEEPNAAIFSDCDLSINGTGTLNVNGNFQHAIRVKADVKITSGTINLYAVQKGFKVKKTFSIMEGSLTIKSGDDGINAGSVINIDGGTIVIEAEDDGVQSDEQIIINAGMVDTEKCKKGFKAPIFTPNGGEIK
ncbi:MAG: carbohydrate-binding domain-containing protein [Lachnospiraceae bacterium]|nr:carbohydrate-binding domain-containing protein [Lachnospiraceae bacterium]